MDQFQLFLTAHDIMSDSKFSAQRQSERTGAKGGRMKKHLRGLWPVAAPRLVGPSSFFWRFGTVIQLGLMLISALWLLRFAVLLHVWPLSLPSGLRAFLDLPTEHPSSHQEEAHP